MEVKSGYNKTDVGIIPEEWLVLTFGELFDVTAGGDVDPKRSTSFRDEIHRYPIYSNALTDRGLYGYCSYADHEAGSITITARGTLGAANFRDHAFTAIGRVLVLQPKRKIAGSYFAAVINSQVKFAIESTGVPQLTAPQISGYKLPVPPLPEQRAIAGALGDVDALLGALEKLITKKRDLKQAAIQHLLTGKTRLPGFSMEVNPGYKQTEVGIIPEEWNVARLGSQADIISKGTTPTTLGGTFVNHGINFVKIEAITDDGRIDSAKLAYIDSTTHNLLRRSQLKTNDILFSIAGALGRTAIVTRELLPSNTNQALAFIRLGAKSNVEHHYLLHYLSGETIRTTINAINVQGAQANLSLQNIREFVIPLPPLPEQRAIAGAMSDMDAEIAALEQRLAKTRALKQGMMQELLTGRVRLV